MKNCFSGHKLYAPMGIDLKEHLSPTRSNGLNSMIKQIKLYALAFKAKARNQSKG